MGWASGTNKDGREVGYSVDAVCDRAGCSKRIDRGLYFVCGGMHDGGSFGCGRYFCGDHFTYVPREWLIVEGEHSTQLCDDCADGLELAYAAHCYIDDRGERRTIAYVRNWSIEGWATVARLRGLTPATTDTVAVALRMLETVEELT